jgi:hypothetical protein
MCVFVQASAQRKDILWDLQKKNKQKKQQQTNKKQTNTQTNKQSKVSFVFVI